MATRNDVFPSKYLKAGDLDGTPLTVTIVSAPLETLKNPEGKEQTKTVLYLRGTKKLLPLNVTNWVSCAEICGDDIDQDCDVYAKAGNSSTAPTPSRNQPLLADYDHAASEFCSWL